jgi:hypothetical protein
MPCRHRESWLIAGGAYEWCYQCGALRTMFESGIAQVTPTSPWCRPTGPKGVNPWSAWNVKRTTYQLRKRALAPAKEDQ